MYLSDKFKPILVFIIVLTLLFSFLVFLILNGRNESKIEFVNGIHGTVESFTFSEAVNKADLIAKVKIRRSIEEIKQFPIYKTIFEADVLDIYKNNTNEFQNNVLIMQQGTAEVPFNENQLFNPSEEYILFLMKATTNNHYWILGEETNMYKIQDGLLIKQSLKDNQLSKIEKSLDKEKLLQYQKGKEIQVINESAFIKLIKNRLEQKGDF